MSLDALTELFKWMTIINACVFVLSAILSISLKNFVGKIHGALFGIDAGKVPLVLYGYMGAYRIFILVFNLVPYVSLLIIGR